MSERYTAEQFDEMAKSASAVEVVYGSGHLYLGGQPVVPMLRQAAETEREREMLMAEVKSTDEAAQRIVEQSRTERDTLKRELQEARDIARRAHDNEELTTDYRVIASWGAPT